MKDAELDRLIAQDMMKSAEIDDATLNQLIYQDMLTQPEPERDSFLSQVGQGALKGVAAAGQFIDRFTGAPTRAAVGELVTGGGILGAGGKFIEQFGADPTLAPTGKEIVQAAGLPEFDLIDDPAKEIDKQLEAQGFTVSKSENAGLTSTGAAGLAVDILADWSNFIPIKAVLKGASQGAKQTGKVTLMAIDTATGTKIATKSADDVARAVDNVLASVKKSFKPTRAGDFSKFEEIAKKNGIDPAILPETVEFGPSSTVTKKAKVMAENPGGEAVQARFRKADFEIENALDRKITELGGGAKLGDAEAGQLLLDSYNNSVKKFFDQDFVTNQRIINENPGLTITDDAAKSIDKELKKMSRFSADQSKGFKAQRAQAAAVDDAVATARRYMKGGKITYKDATEMLSNIGEEAFKKFKGDDPIGAAYRKKLQDLYFTVRESMNGTVAGKVSDEAAMELANSNAIISEFLTDKGVVNKIMSSDVPTEKILKSMVDNADTKKIEALNKMFDYADNPAAKNQFKGFVADKLVKRNAKGKPLYDTSINNMTKKRDILGLVFNPKETIEISELLELGSRKGDFILNTSATNTAARFSPLNFIKELGASASDEVMLERMKDIARGRAIDIPTPNGPLKITQEQAIEYLPFFTKKIDKIKLKEAGKISGTQETNRKIEAERRQRAMQ